MSKIEHVLAELAQLRDLSESQRRHIAELTARLDRAAAWCGRVAQRLAAVEARAGLIPAPDPTPATPATRPRRTRATTRQEVA